jgi:hypothetical protein
MDILAHTLWTNAGARAANKVAEKKGKRWRISVGWAAFFGVAPDFFAFTISFVIAIYRAVFFGVPLARGPQALSTGGFDLAAYLYQFSHSVVIWAYFNPTIITKTNITNFSFDESVIIANRTKHYWLFFFGHMVSNKLFKSCPSEESISRLFE